MEKISVIIVNWNVAELFLRCIKSVLDTKYPNLELILIDNNSNKVPKIPKDPRITFIQNKSNIGLPQAWNQALKIVTGDYVLILNPDTRLPKDFFEKSILLLKNDPKIGVMGPKLIDPDGTPQGSVSHEIKIINAIREFWFGQKGTFEKYIPTENHPLEVDTVSGACMFIPKSVIQKIGLFTEKVFMYYEEKDYCRRVRRAGLKVVFDPNITIVHEHGQSSVQNPKVKRYIIQASKWYNGLPKYYILWFIMWTSQKFKKIIAAILPHKP